VSRLTTRALRAAPYAEGGQVPSAASEKPPAHREFRVKQCLRAIYRRVRATIFAQRWRDFHRSGRLRVYRADAGPRLSGSRDDDWPFLSEGELVLLQQCAGVRSARLGLQHRLASGSRCASAVVKPRSHTPPSPTGLLFTADRQRLHICANIEKRQPSRSRSSGSRSAIMAFSFCSSAALSESGSLRARAAVPAANNF
jgi:hypothetical protein